ncbi:hypothetical protein D8M06_00645 [Oceanobacillus halophilus]|uniref:Cell-wall binding lipoprotein n=2 Tax=Oceanobacillus halophilus TaxID=930130 RepID=A0A495ADS2_9BACI|nr:hypothetical protein D8M06_00645 [Oceanobacillus halophilus]
MIGIIVVLSGCNSETIEEKMYTHLEEAVRLEAEFEKQQNEITELERKEQQIYSQIIDLDMDEFDQITELSQEAIQIIGERAELIDLEKESIDSSESEFKETEGLIKEIKDEEVKAKAEEMFEVMEERYRSYDQLNEAYIVSLDLEKKLYEMLQQEDLEQDELTEHINNINESYQEVLEANEQFNEFTVEYNNLKKEFYEIAGIEVDFEENPTSDEENDNK